MIGIGVDTTGSTPLPIDAAARPLALDARWRDNLAAHAWLWKDHTGAAEAAAITDAARAHAPYLLAPIGGTYSSEWWWSKIWHCLKVAPDVFDAAASWVELADFMPGRARRRRPIRGRSSAASARPATRRCTATRGAAFRRPSSSQTLDPRLAALRARLYDTALPPGTPAGTLCARVGGDARSAGRDRDRDGRASTRTTRPSAPASGPARSSRSSARRRATARCCR